MSLKNPASTDILGERYGGTIRLRCSYGRRPYARINTLFFLSRECLTITAAKWSCLKQGYRIERYRYRFDEIKYLKLGCWAGDGEVEQYSYWIFLYLLSGGQINLSFLTNDFDKYDKAVTGICEATKIKRFDPAF